MKNKKLELSRKISNGIFGNTNKEFIKRDKWTSNELKLFLTIIFKVQEKGKNEIVLKPRDFEKNITHGNHFKYFNKLITNIKNKNFFMKIDEDTFRNYSLFSYIEYNNSKDDIKIKINEDLRGQFFDIKSFTKIELNEILGLNSYYSIKTRLLLSSVNNKTEYVMDIERFKLMFQIPLSYKNKNIEDKVFNTILRENKEVEEIHFKKNGRTATHVVIKYNLKNMKIKDKKENILSDIILKAIIKAKKNIFVSKSWGVAEDVFIKKTLEKHGEKLVLGTLKKLHTNLKSDVTVSLVSYMSAIIKAEDEVKKEIEDKKIIIKNEDKQKIEKKEAIENIFLKRELQKRFLKENGFKSFDLAKEGVAEMLKKYMDRNIGSM